MTYELFPMEEGSGFYVNGLAGEVLSAKKLVYLDSNDRWKLADIDVALTMPVFGITIDALTSGLKGKILLGGFIGDPSWDWTLGAKIYATSTSGELTDTLPTTGHVQLIGIAYSSNKLLFNPQIVTSLHTTETIPISSDAFGRPNTNPPDIVDQDNLTLYEFTVNTDRMTYKFPIPTDYLQGDLIFNVIWTNDGGVDDNGKKVKWQLSYQVGEEGDVISGNHANSPKTVEDAYTSDLGWVEHHTGSMTIAAADFEDKICLFLKLMAITAPAIVLTCEPHLMGMCYTYQIKKLQLPD